MRAAKVQASLRIRAVSPEPSLLAHRSSESRGTFRQKARSLTPLNVWACAVKICHDGMLEDRNSLDGAQFIVPFRPVVFGYFFCFVFFCLESDACDCCPMMIISLLTYYCVNSVQRNLWPPWSWTCGLSGD